MKARSGRDTTVRQALEELCRLYWMPLYCYARHTGLSKEDAEDSVQGFLAGFLEKGAFATADEERGRLRNFLLTAFQNHLKDIYRRQQTAKRGGGINFISIDAAAGETGYAAEPADPHTPESLYQRRWAATVLAAVLEKLAKNYARENRADTYALLRPYLGFDTGDPMPYAKLAPALGVSEAAVKVTIHRFRQRFQRLLHEHVADTLSDPSPEAVKAEIRELIEALT